MTVEIEMKIEEIEDMTEAIEMKIDHMIVEIEMK